MAIGGTERGTRRCRLLASRPVARTVAAVIFSTGTAGFCEVPRVNELVDLSLEQLGNIEVTSVSRQAERLSDAPASIYVISNEDIRRSGARTLPEALRLAPNLQVARSNANSYAISARGFAADSVIGNKLLVLIDGRTVYSPLFSSVFWDQQDVMLEDIERIEVISGPGATLWGANAVNGVINVITRSSRDTQGGLASVGLGNLDQGVSARYGGKLGADGTFRVYAKNYEFQNTQRLNGSSVPDGGDRGQAGFRADWGTANHGFTVQGDTYSGRIEERPVGGSVETSGTNVLARWNHRLSSGSDLRLQAYYDRTERVDRIGFQGSADVFDIEFQQSFHLAAHRVLWGAGYRRSRDDIPPTLAPAVIAFVPPGRTLDWSNVFVQDEIPLGPTLGLTVGLKLERNDYTGWEYLPSARLAWKPADQHLVWGALSRAVRAPARLDRDFTFTLVAPPARVPLILGGPTFESETANVLELGYRGQPVPALSYSATAFFQDYDRLRSGQPPPAFIQNMIQGPVAGVEAWGTFAPVPWWRLSGGFTTLHEHLGLEPGSRDPVGPSALGNDPKYQWQVRSAFNFGTQHELDFALRRVGALPLPVVPAYYALDARWGWKVSRSAEVSLTLENLFDGGHAEFGALPGRSEYGRSAFLKLVLRQ